MYLSVCVCVVDIGKDALPQLVRKLPSPAAQSELMLSDETVAAVQAAIYEIIKTNSTHAWSVSSSVVVVLASV